jgi:hypothetical protein
MRSRSPSRPTPVRGRDVRAPVHFSVSTWRQPIPASASRVRAAAVEHVAGRVLACGRERLLVGIDGLTAAGKTSFGHELAVRISTFGRPVLRASLDDFKKPWRDRHLYDRESGEGYYRNAFDYAAVTRLLLEPAGVGASGACALCSIDPLTQLDHSNVITQAARNAVLIVDGVFAFRPDSTTTGVTASGCTSTRSSRCGEEPSETRTGQARRRRRCIVTATSRRSSSTSTRWTPSSSWTSSSTTPSSSDPRSSSSADNGVRLTRHFCRGRLFRDGDKYR